MTRCKEEVWADRAFRPHRCTRKAVEEGYCRQHSPSAKKERADARHAKWQRQHDVANARKATADARHRVVACALTFVDEHCTDQGMQDVIDAVRAYRAAEQAEREVVNGK